MMPLAALELPPAFTEPLLNLWAFLARDGSDGRFRESDFPSLTHLGLNPARMRAVVAWLNENGWLRQEQASGPDGAVYEFTPSALPHLERLTRSDPDRVVAASLAARHTAADALQALSRAAAHSNQLAADHPERLPMYRASIDAGAGLLRDHAPTVDMVRATSLSPARWMLQQAATAVVRDAADHAIRLLTGLL